MRGRGKDKKGRSYYGPPFVQLHHFLLDSEAWLALSTPARAVYVEIARRYYGVNNGTIGLSVRDAAKLCRINKDTATRAFRQLEALGFIECITPGGFSQKVRHATEWRLTAFHCDKSGAPASKKFTQWRAPPPIEKKPRSPISIKPVPSMGTVVPLRPRKWV